MLCEIQAEAHSCQSIVSIDLSVLTLAFYLHIRNTNLENETGKDVLNKQLSDATLQILTHCMT